MKINSKDALRRVGGLALDVTPYICIVRQMHHFQKKRKGLIKRCRDGEFSKDGAVARNIINATRVPLAMWYSAFCFSYGSQKLTEIRKEYCNNRLNPHSIEQKILPNP
jgi:hypothetical protein